jgi:hypothetical protein
MSSPSSSSLSSNSSSSSPSNEPCSSYARQLSSHSSLSVSSNSNTAPKKSILLRTFSQNDGVLDDTRSNLNLEQKANHAILLNRTNSSFNNHIQQFNYQKEKEQEPEIQTVQHQQKNILKFLNMHNKNGEEIASEPIISKRKYFGYLFEILFH